ncbi:hypothetical protein QTI17_20175 [Variovorax sp. J31P179]|uniref:hypothetical protein n=1 Tax=Variovorax sp. J31P179 TaxID=3053508 RepID=UPI0025763421|nr:hypothetical protein [Variovorax sp. J31P179]MDM0082914.1 hypothetical protein [Variovorax sp. J31P179]
MGRIWTWIKSPGVMAFAAIFGIALAVYQGFFYERKPELTVRVDALSPVFDIHQPVGGLSISYGGEDLRSAKKTLWVLKATISNTGNAELRKGDYDDRAPLGLEVRLAEVVDQPTVHTSNAYLSENLRVVPEKHSVRLTPVILEPGDSLELTLLLLGPESNRPEIVPVGKIAGLRGIVYLGPNAPEDSTSVWRQSIQGDSLLVHPIRAIIYFFGTLLFLSLFAALAIAVTSPFRTWKEHREKQSRQTQMREYRRHGELGRAQRFLIDIYIEKGADNLKRVARVIRKLEAVEDSVRLLEEKGATEEEIKKFFNRTIFFPQYMSESVEKDLRAAQLLEGDEVNKKLNGNLPAALEELSAFLKIDLVKEDQYAMEFVSLQGARIVTVDPDPA